MRDIELPEGWEILLACYLLGGRVEGKVRLQKVVSEMQKEGYPVDHIFIIHKMGPLSTAIYDETRFLENTGLIKIKMVQVGEGYNDRFDYILTGEGEKVVKEEILPVLSEDYYFLKENLETIRTKYDNRRFSQEIVREVHEELLLENRDRFRKKLRELLEKYTTLHEKFSKKDYPFCLVWIASYGLVDLVKDVLEIIGVSETFQDGDTGFFDFDIDVLEEEAGKYFIVAKAGEGLKLVSNNCPFEECIENSECISDKWEKCKILELKIRGVFEAIRHNADLYGFLDKEEEGDELPGPVSVEGMGL